MKCRVWTLDTVRDRCTEEGDCWIWVQCLQSGKWPHACINGKNTRVRPFIWRKLMKKRIPRGRVISTSCGDHRCCSPLHLKPITHAEKIRAGYENHQRNNPQEYKSRLAEAVRRGITKLDIDKARAIRGRRSESRSVVAADYAVHPSTISKIWSGEYWRDNSNGSSVFNWRPQ